MALHDTSIDGDSSRSSNLEEHEKGTMASRFIALVLIIPGIMMYVYILYIMFSKIIYPGSFSPFTSRSSPPRFSGDNDNNTIGYDAQVTQSILMDAALLCIFVFQHSLMASRSLKALFEDINMSAILRSLYVCFTCAAINLIYLFWSSTPYNTLWEFESLVLHLVLLVIHLTCWVSIACSVFTIDYLELLGIKQLYYSYYGFDNPWHYKSAEQQQLLSHSRHPIFLAPLIILWAVPVMTYDRFLVAVMLPLYIGWGSSLDQYDVIYVTGQFGVKRSQLLANGDVKSN